jgi:hypothetical protein
LNQNIKKLNNKQNARGFPFKILAFVLILMLSLFVSQTTMVSASTPEWEDPTEVAKLKGLGSAVWEFAYDLYAGDALLSSNTVTALQVDILEGGEFYSVWGKVDGIYQVISTVGMLLLMMYWLLELLEKVQSDSFTLEHFVRASIKLIIGILLMSNGMDLFRGVLTVANGIFSNIQRAESLTATASASNEILNRIWEDCKYYTDHMIKGANEMIGWGLRLILPSIAMKLIKVVIYVVLYSRIIELFVRITFAPIGMANIYSGGLNSSGFKYIKKIAAVAFAGCVIFAILLAYTELSSLINNPPAGSYFASLGTNAISQLVLGFTVITLIIKAQGWSNDIIGV